MILSFLKGYKTAIGLGRRDWRRRTRPFHLRRRQQRPSMAKFTAPHRRPAEGVDVVESSATNPGKTHGCTVVDCWCRVRVCVRGQARTRRAAFLACSSSPGLSLPCPARHVSVCLQTLLAGVGVCLSSSTSEILMEYRTPCVCTCVGTKHCNCSISDGCQPALRFAKLGRRGRCVQHQV